MFWVRNFTYASIWNSENIVIGAISITAILYRIKFQEILKFLNLLIAECKEVSKKLGYLKVHIFSVIFQRFPQD